MDKQPHATADRFANITSDSDTTIARARERLVSSCHGATKTARTPYQVSFAFPDSINGLRYTLESPNTRDRVGAVEACKSLPTGDCRSYVAVLLLDHFLIESFELKDSPGSFIFFSGDRIIGGLQATEYRSCFGIRTPHKWVVSCEERCWGVVVRGAAVTCDNLSIHLSAGGTLPLHIGRKDSVYTVFRSLLRIFLHGHLFLQPSVNTDNVVFLGDLTLTRDELRVYFLTVSVFRTILFGIDFN